MTFFLQSGLSLLYSLSPNFLICNPTPSAHTTPIYRPILSPEPETLMEGVNAHFQTYATATKAKEELLPAVWD